MLTVPQPASDEGPFSRVVGHVWCQHTWWWSIQVPERRRPSEGRRSSVTSEWCREWPILSEDAWRNLNKFINVDPYATFIFIIFLYLYNMLNETRVLGRIGGIEEGWIRSQAINTVREIKSAPISDHFFLFRFYIQVRCFTLFTIPFFSPPPTMSLNLNATFVGSSSDLTASQLYAGLNVDFSQLNWFETQWMAWYIWIGNPLIATGIASFILHEVRSLILFFRHKTDPVVCTDRLFWSLHTVDDH